MVMLRKAFWAYEQLWNEFGSHSFGLFKGKKAGLMIFSPLYIKRAVDMSA